MKPHETKTNSLKRSTSIVLPGNMEIYQSNRITNSKYKSFTLLQSRILVTLIKELQQAILASMNGKDWQQLNLFPSEDHSLIRVPIFLKDIAKPRQYREVYDAILQLAKTSIELPSSINKQYYCIATLFPRVELPKKVNGKSVIYVELFKTAAQKLIEIDKTGNGKPGYFTRYLYEVAMNAKNKYTYKLYMIIASWKQKGGFKISVQELKEQLGISPFEYTQYKEFKRRVLLPAQRDLEYRSDCWFNCSAAGFEIRNERKVGILNFKVIVPAPQIIVREKTDHLIYLLRTHFEFSDSNIKALENYFAQLTDLNSFELVFNKLQDLKQYIYKTNGTPKQVNHVPSYVVKTIRNLL